MLINNLENNNKSINNNSKISRNHFSIQESKILFKIKIYNSKRKYKVSEYLKAKIKQLKIFMVFLTKRKNWNLINL